jgi:hypothetical protein
MMDGGGTGANIEAITTKAGDRTIVMIIAIAETDLPAHCWQSYRP